MFTDRRSLLAALGVMAGTGAAGAGYGGEERMPNPYVVSVRAHGAPGDGSDATAAVSRAFAAANALAAGGARPVVRLEAGIYALSEPPPILVGVSLVGDGPRESVLKLAPEFRGDAVAITGTGFGSANQRTAETLDLVRDLSGVSIRGFSVVGDRSGGTQNGIVAYGANDRAIFADIGIYHCRGFGLALGVQAQAGQMATVRECHFINILVHRCGDADLERPAMLLTSAVRESSGRGDGANQNDFFNIKIIHPHWTALRISNPGGGRLIIRRNAFVGLMTHGFGRDDGLRPPAPLVHVDGRVGLLSIQNWDANSQGHGHWAMLVEPGLGGAPRRLDVAGSIVNCTHGIALHGISESRFDLIANEASQVQLEARALAGPVAYRGWDYGRIVVDDESEKLLAFSM